MKKTFILYIIIAFLSGMICMDFALGMKVPDVIMGADVNPDLREIIEDYVIRILNESRYQCRVSASAIASGDELEEGEFLLDNSGVTKYFVISNGTTNYRVQVTEI